MSAGWLKAEGVVTLRNPSDCLIKFGPCLRTRTIQVRKLLNQCSVAAIGFLARDSYYQSW